MGTEAIVLRKATLLCLLVHLVALAASQTAYREGFLALRWVSLFAMTGFGALDWVTSPPSPASLRSVAVRVLVYLSLWGLTVVNSDHSLFSAYRWSAHAMIVVASLVFLPRLIRLTDAAKLLLALKLIVGVVLVVSYFRPAERTYLDNPSLYRGILGNPNALGHMAAVGGLLFLHGFITQRRTRWGYFQGAMAGLAGVLLIQSGARSSTLAFLGGFLVMYVLYRSSLSRNLVIGAAIAVAALALSPDLTVRISAFIFKHSEFDQTSEVVDRITASRQTAWENHWQGFKERPWLGWGFGVDRNADLSKWNGDLTALGVTGRDPVNDVMYTLESGGVLGLFAYFYVLALIMKAWIPAPVRATLDTALRRRGNEQLASLYDANKAFVCLTGLLIVMFEWDNTALAAGNFFAALLWVSLGLSLGSHSKLMRSLHRPSPAPAPRPVLDPVGRVA